MTDAAAHAELRVLNGIDVEAGGYLTPTLALAHVAGSLRGDAAPPPGLRELRRRRLDPQDNDSAEVASPRASPLAEDLM